MSDQATDTTIHVYDGIEEYDNPLPGWWTALFWGTIFFSIVYLFLIYSHANLVHTKVAYEESVTRELERQFATLGLLEPDNDTLYGFVSDPEQSKWLAVGEAIFQTNCVSCHGRDGSGISGPNMTDDVYKNIKQLSDIPHIVKEGANKGAMPAWGNRLQQNEVVLVSAYVASLRGNNLIGRAAEGEPIPDWAKAN